MSQNGNLCVATPPSGANADTTDVSFFEGCWKPAHFRNHCDESNARKVGAASLDDRLGSRGAPHLPNGCNGACQSFPSSPSFISQTLPRAWPLRTGPPSAGNPASKLRHNYGNLPTFGRKSQHLHAAAGVWPISHTAH